MKRNANRAVSMLLAIILTISLLSFVTPAASAAELKTAVGTVKASALRLRQKPSTSATILATAPSGDAVLVIGRSGDWYQVIYNLKTGYMHKDYLQLDQVKNIQIGNARFDSNTNVRQGPGTGYGILTCAPKGSTCFIIGFNHDWFKVTYNGKTGYVRSDLVTMLEIPYCNAASSGGSGDDAAPEDTSVNGKTARFLYGTNIRQGPGTNYSILTSAPKGSTCTLVSLRQNWYQVSYKGKSGYVRSDLVELVTGSGGGDTTPSAALASASMSREEKLKLVFGSANISDPRKVYSSASEARTHMREITVKTWDLKSSGEKYSRSWTLQVHENIAPTVQAIFDEIYALPEQPPIHSLGGYRWANTSEHSVGLAIDINPNENYYCDPNGNALTGSYFRPDSDPYSIPVGGSIDRIFAKYGFTRGINWRSGYKDYMHYSFFGT